MLSVNMNIQHIDWGHDAIDNDIYEGDHIGTLASYLIIPGLTVGISDYLNFSYSQTIGVRSMHWGGDGASDHHRSETSLTDYDNSNGGVFGDARLKLRYLYKNTGMKEGNRVYFGFGVLIPSKNVLTSSPFFETGEVEPHRHFSLSEGAYKGLLEFQIFKKKSVNPVFYGLVSNIEIPIYESKYGYTPGITYNLTSSLIYRISSKAKILPSGLSLGLSFVGTTEASWNEEIAKNSESQLLVPSIGGSWQLSKGTLSFSLQKPFFLTGLSNDDSDGDLDTNDKANAIELVIGYRRNLGYLIPWL